MANLATRDSRSLRTSSKTALGRDSEKTKTWRISIIVSCAGPALLNPHQSSIALGSRTNSRHSMNLRNEPPQDTREGEAQQLLEEVRKPLAQSVQVDDARLTRGKRLLADGRRDAEEDARICRAAWEASASYSPQDEKEGEERTKNENVLHQLVRDPFAE